MMTISGMAETAKLAELALMLYQDNEQSSSTMHK